MTRNARLLLLVALVAVVVLSGCGGGSQQIVPPSVVVTITTDGSGASPVPIGRNSLPWGMRMLEFPAICFGAVLLSRPRRRARQVLCMLTCLVLIAGVTVSCGGPSGSKSAASTVPVAAASVTAGTYTVLVTAAGAGVQRSATLTVTVQ